MTEVVTIGNATLWRGDCREVLPKIGKVDAVITDPPYSERTHSGHNATQGADGSVRSVLGYSALSTTVATVLATEFCRATDAWIVWMTDHTLAPTIREALERENRYVFAPLPYFAPGSRVRLTGDGPSSWTDWIIVARTAKQVRWGTLPGGYVAGPGWDDKQHMGGKPTSLMVRLVNDYSRFGDTVVDPFMGSGTTGAACSKLGRKFIGIEIDEKCFHLACARIEQEQKQAALFPHDHTHHYEQLQLEAA